MSSADQETSAGTRHHYNFPNGIDVVDSDEESLTPTKVFAHFFRLAFKKNEDAVWVEVRTLDGLRNVARKLETGELQEIDRFTTLEMQLWGLMAEHSGFLRAQGSPSALAAGIMPLGAGAASLTHDLAAILGGDDVEAINELSTMQRIARGAKNLVSTDPSEPVESEHKFVKADGVNLTTEGEDALRDLVLGSTFGPDGTAKKPRAETVEFEKESENAIEIFKATPAAPPEPLNSDEDQEPVEPKIYSGEEAKAISQLIEGVMNIDFDEDTPLAGLEQYGVSMEDLRALASAGAPSEVPSSIADELAKQGYSRDAFFENLVKITLDDTPSQPSEDALPRDEIEDTSEFDPKDPYKQRRSKD